MTEILKLNRVTPLQAQAKACCGSGLRPAENGCCVADACMAWRWEKPSSFTAAMQQEPPTHGYCGRAER